ncbi:MAG: hypothetical protein JW870_08750 [Candidatus Delongbacteria bacterium]|nr:hypothetical protein [Candidatus Delongbacteria bacterium]
MKYLFFVIILILRLASAQIINKENGFDKSNIILEIGFDTSFDEMKTKFPKSIYIESDTLLEKFCNLSYKETIIDTVINEPIQVPIIFTILYDRDNYVNFIYFEIDESPKRNNSMKDIYSTLCRYFRKKNNYQDNKRFISNYNEFKEKYCTNLYNENEYFLFNDQASEFYIQLCNDSLNNKINGFWRHWNDGKNDEKYSRLCDVKGIKDIKFGMSIEDIRAMPLSFEIMEDDYLISVSKDKLSMLSDEQRQVFSIFTMSFFDFSFFGIVSFINNKAYEIKFTPVTNKPTQYMFFMFLDRLSDKYGNPIPSYADYYAALYDKYYLGKLTSTWKCHSNQVHIEIYVTKQDSVFRFEYQDGSYLDNSDDL